MRRAHLAPERFDTIEWRCIGPHRGGRVVAVAGDPTHAQTFYFGACAGGVWKTTDGGTYWENVSDGFFGTAAVGAIAVAPSDPNVIYAGTGEACIRVDVSHGDGVYRSTDGGATWRRVGLIDTRHVGRIRIDPHDPDLVYVAALGHAFGPNEQRGVFRSRDGGANWERVLFRNAETGAIDLCLDPTNPRVLYAALWQVIRRPWILESGGPGSGIFKSIDGGDTWTELTGNPGLPEGIKGRIGIACSPARPSRVWAIVEAEQGALFRSEDGGATWEVASAERDLRQRPWYYHHVFADPQDADTVWVLNLQAWKSTDAGKTFTGVSTPHGDNHDLWIDPADPRRMIEGNDGGACVSFNGGDTWSTIYNQPTAQFYHVTTDTRVPYRVYGTQQDNSAISVPSRSDKGLIRMADCYTVGSSESGHIQVRPDNPDVVYSGAIGSAPGGGGVMLRYDHATAQARIITAWPEEYGGWGPKDLRYRFQWTYPILISPHDPGVLYIAGNVVFRSTDEGASWEPISPDLTRDDKSKQEPSGGPITKDTTGAEHYCTIFAFVESPHRQGLFWAGSDDGLVHLSRDGGADWQRITPPGLPEWATVATIELAPHDPAAAYLAAFRYKLDDYRPYLFKTADYGATWTPITGGLPDDDFTRVIRADPVRPGLLYAGTERGLYVSCDDGASWLPFNRNLPVAPIHDLAIRGDDLIAATHGRSFWITDGLGLLRQLAAGPAAPVRLFEPAPALRMAGDFDPTAASGKQYATGLGLPGAQYVAKMPDGGFERRLLDAGANPRAGVVLHYHLQEEPQGEVTLAFHDANGTDICSFSSVKPEPPAADGADGKDRPLDEPSNEPLVPVKAGMNRFVWDMRYPGARQIAGSTDRPSGPVAAPGRYEARLTVAGETHRQPFEIRKDPRIAATQQDMQAQFDLAMRIRDKLSAANDAVSDLRSVCRQADEWAGRAKDGPGEQAVAEAAGGLRKELQAIEAELVEPLADGALNHLNHPVKLIHKLAGLTSVVTFADAAPTRQAYEVYDHLAGLIDRQIDRLKETLGSRLPAFGDLLREHGVPAVVPDDRAGGESATGRERRSMGGF